MIIFDGKAKFISIETVIDCNENYYMIQCILINNKNELKVEIITVFYNVDPDITRMIIHSNGFYYLYKELSNRGYLNKFLEPLPEEERLSTKLLFEIGEL